MTFDKEKVLDVILHKVKEEWKRTESVFPEFLRSYDQEEKQVNESRVSKSIEQIKEQLNKLQNPLITFGNKEKWRQETERLFTEILSNEPILGINEAMPKDTLDAFNSELKKIIKRVRKFDEDLKIEDIGQAIRNYMVYAIFKELNGMPQKCSSSIFGYSMLYPYTDNYIDNSKYTINEKKHFNKMIEDKLKGVSYEAISVHEKKTAELLSYIEDDYGRPDAIFEGLLLMLEAQKNSQKQENSDFDLSAEDILDISVFKGGLSVMIDRYFINKPFSENDFYFYYSFGFLLQLCDDLQDITEDKERGSRTLFSSCQSSEETEGNIYRLIQFTHNLFKSCESVREEFRAFLLCNCYFLILFSAIGSKEHISDKGLLRLEEKLPVSAAYFKEFRGGLSSEKLEQNRDKYMKMIDIFVEK